MKRSLFVHLPVFIATRTAINTMIRMVYPFLPVFGRGLGVDLGMLSTALTLRSASGIFAPFLASVADSRGRKAGMLFGLTLFTAGVGLMAFWPSYPTFVLTLLLSIMGNFVFIPSMQAYLGDRVPYRRRGLVLALTEFGWSLSFIIGVPLMGLAIARGSWLTPFPLLTGLGVLGLLVLASLLPGDHRTGDSGPGVWRNLRTVLDSPSALAGILLAVLISAANELVNFIFGVWLEEAFAVRISALAAASAVIGLSELGGESLVSAFSDWLGKRRAVAIGLILNGLAAVTLPLLGRNLTGALLGLFLLYLTFEFTLVGSIPLMTEVLPSARATFMSTFIAGASIGRALGAKLSPVLYEFGRATGEASGLRIIILIAVVFNLVALAALRVIKIAGAEEDPMAEL